MDEVEYRGAATLCFVAFGYKSACVGLNHTSFKVAWISSCLHKHNRLNKYDETTGWQPVEGKTIEA